MKHVLPITGVAAILSVLVMGASAQELPQSRDASVIVTPGTDIAYLVEQAGIDSEDAELYRIDGNRLYVKGVTQSALQNALRSYDPAAAAAARRSAETEKVVKTLTAGELLQALIEAGVVTRAQVVQSVLSQRGL